MTLEAPSGVNRTVARTRPRKSEPYGGERQWFTQAEIEKLMTVARKHGRHGFRDSLMVLLGYVHGFRASELVRLQWTDIDWERGLIHCRRVKNGTNTDHPLTGREMRGLRKLKAEQKPPSRYIFMTERCAPFTPDGFYKLMIRLGEKAKIASARPRRLRARAHKSICGCTSCRCSRRNWNNRLCQQNHSQLGSHLESGNRRRMDNDRVMANRYRTGGPPSRNWPSAAR